MLPGYITLYKDDDGFIHLYFFQGLTDDNRTYYNKLDLPNDKYKYKVIVNNDNSSEYIFENKRIKSMSCNLVSYNNKILNKILTIKK